jgi:hypothetical protein
MASSEGQVTYGPLRRTYAAQVANAGNFEAVLSFGVGVAKREPFHVFTLANPSRFIIDIAAPFRTAGRRTAPLDKTITCLTYLAKES